MVNYHCKLTCELVYGVVMFDFRNIVVSLEDRQTHNTARDQTKIIICGKILIISLLTNFNQDSALIYGIFFDYVLSFKER